MRVCNELVQSHNETVIMISLKKSRNLLKCSFDQDMEGTNITWCAC